MRKEKILAYPAVFHKEDEKGYWVEFPDLRGCLTEGETYEEALFMASDALKEWMSTKETLHIDEFIQPTELETIIKRFPGELVMMVEYNG